ncbi:sigma-54-dependent transcriptional regulator [Desulfobacca acetoxidans]|uniref:Two component, sigma54 specific, transcriptional regulator, Fis family n=1 Tax=Desulfobacca acetoxidans (strain ATCC 700848 / DSM 11109 / ASRB2) TaxID=880072 RepID=F2NEY6_DESAR|nr:sigma-54 dependent transcriptional regulator [Desulfobacca acetoxidans]AEB08326.1 two component, sigma54 specific, transcriptional regulator, Fis family [Desulfobacca acetoxidans DSM 11109]
MRIAVVDDEEIVRKRLQKTLEKEGHRVQTYPSGEAFLGSLEGASFDLVFLDVILPGLGGMEILQSIKARTPDLEVILITGHASLDAAIEAVKLGAFHYVSKPLRLEEIRHLTRKALEHKRLLEENRQLKARLEPLQGWEEMIGVSPVMKEVFQMVRKVAPLDCSVLIQGESGTGKELVARLIHRESSRRDQPFLAFNCAGFTEELIASELFGYERGAFTGATATKIGFMEAAHHGTIFMDEIGDMPLSMQAKLLRVIQDRRIFRVGASRPIQLDLRFIAATNKELKQEVQAGRFREDLFFRLKVVEITLPRLADRPEDIPLLMQFFLSRYSHRFGKQVRIFNPDVREILLSYDYPGNVRELKNLLERAVALAEGETITVAELPPEMRESVRDSSEPYTTLEDREREYILRVLRHTNFNVGDTARILNLPRTTLWRKMKKYNLSKA